MSKPDPPPGGQPASAVRARTLPLQGLVNRVIRGLLCTPLLCRLVGKRLITVYLVGRKSGRRYAVPVAYARCHGTPLVGTQFASGERGPARIRIPQPSAPAGARARPAR